MRRTSAGNQAALAERPGTDAPSDTALSETYAQAASIVPKGLNELDRETYLRATVKASFDAARRLLEMNSSNTPVIVTELFFAFDDATISREHRILLAQVAEELRKSPQYVVEMRGYADDVGESAYNLELSRQRAQNVRNQLALLIPQIPISYQGYGKLRYVPLHAPEWRQRARKVEIVLIKPP